jgi:hypothetical protein
VRKHKRERVGAQDERRAEKGANIRKTEKERKIDKV